jgi:hypothetical protein
LGEVFLAKDKPFGEFLFESKAKGTIQGIARMRSSFTVALRRLPAAHRLVGPLVAAMICCAEGAQSSWEVRAVMITGSPAPGIADVTVSFPSLPWISEHGHIVFATTLTGTGVTATNDRAIYVETPGLDLALVMREGAPAPGTSYAFDAPGNAYAVDANGTVGVQASLVNAPNNARVGVWSGTASGLVLRELQGQAAPGTGSTFSNVFLTAMNGSASGSYIASRNTLNDRRVGIWVHGPAGLRKVAVEGDPAPGTAQTFDAIGFPTVDSQGNSCFAAALSDLRLGYWIENPTPMPVILSGQNLPVGLGAFGQFSSVGRISANASKKVAFMGGVTGAGITPANDRGIWTDRSGAFELIARAGAAAPGLASVVLTNFNNVLINGSNQVAFVSRLLGDGYGASTDMALTLMIRLQARI